MRSIGLHGGQNIKILILLFFLENFGAKKLGSNAFITGPGRYRKVEEK